MDPMTDGLVRNLELKHRTLNEQVDRFARRAYLTHRNSWFTLR